MQADSDLTVVVAVAPAVMPEMVAMVALKISNQLVVVAAVLVYLDKAQMAQVAQNTVHLQALIRAQQVQVVRQVVVDTLVVAVAPVAQQVSMVHQVAALDHQADSQVAAVLQVMLSIRAMAAVAEH